MDDRKDDDDADPIRWSHNRKVQSFSQPLGRDAVIAAAKRSAASNRKLSLDTTTATSTSPTVAPSPYHQHHHAHHRSTSSESVPYPLQPFTSDPLTLDRAMNEFGGGAGTLPEFTGPGGNAGIFRAPIRAAVHPNRPPAVELRPHPLRETQFGAFLRTIVCAEREIWAGQESGLRVWRIADMFEVGGGRVKRGDEESAPFKESGRCSPTLCMVVDAATGVVWSGHKDGKIRSWKVSRNLFEEEGEGAIVAVEKGGRDAAAAFKEGLSWQAHRSPVLCMAISSYGDIWSGSENGVVRVWPWESIDKSLCLSAEERHMAALLVERSYVDLRAICTVNGVCPLPPSDVKHMLADTGKSKIWSASSFSFALWDARKRELLKVFGLNGQVDSKVVDTGPPSQDSHGNEDDMKVKFVSSTKKEKSHSFLQRSRNALLGAADAVRRVAAKSAFAEDNRKTEALASTMDGMVWTGFNNGSLIQWDGNGNRVFDVQHQSHSVKSICTFGTRLWVGYVNGTVQVLDLEGNLIGSWTAHGSAVIKMAIGGSYIFTLANHGGIRGWNLTSPGPIDNILRSELSNKELQFTKYENLKILCGTWNVGQSRASHDSLISWLASAASEVGLVVVGLQEVEMGAGFLAMAATKEIVGLEGSANGQWWLDTIGKTLDEGTSFERVGSRQLAGLLIGAWARKSMRPHIGDVDAAAVACGLGRAIGNKGGVGLRMRVYDRIICFANCHFAAHLEAVSRRNADFDHIYRTMSFTRPSHGLQPSSGSGSSSAPLNRGGNVTASHSDDGRPELSEADMLVFLGDFNYRLHSITYDEARDMVSQRCFDWLREKDQLRAEMKCGKVFQGMREGQINFPPTYKFEKHKTGLSGFDSSEKKRIPAWCDRILYRDSRSIAVAECSLQSPVVTSVTLYEACMDVTDSDHKPVRCKFNVEIARIVESIRRKECGELISSDERIKALLREYCNVPETIVSTNSITLQNSEKSILRITNKCDRFKVSFEVVCEGQCTVKEAGDATEFCPKGSFGLPQWLQVHPAAGIAKPGQIIDVTVHYDEYYTQEEHVDGIPSNWWCEDTRDKEVILLVNVMGSYSTERMVHRVHVRRCLPPQASSLKETKGNTSARVPSNHFQVPDFADFENNSVDPGPDLSETRAP